MAIPTKDTLLIPWGSNFDTKVTASPVTYGLTAAQATSFHTAYTAYVTAYNAVATAREAGTRSKVLTATKDTARRALLTIGRELYGYVQDNTSVSVANKQDVGVNPRNLLPSPVPPPGEAPDIDILSTVGNVVKIRLHRAGSTRRAKPAGASGAAVFSFIGAAAPTDEAVWKFEGNTSLAIFDVSFPPATAPGAKVWFCAFWFNQRKQAGPPSAPVGTNIPGGSAMAA
jgi:hypothetical protein